MCIRDSNVVVRDVRNDEGTDGSLATHIHCSRRAWRLGRKAVSYTHLRAHETVLDLVCRLLLEKKKLRI